MTSALTDYFNQFFGVWSLERKISSGESLNGKAVFEHVSDTAFLLREMGDLTLLNGSTISASRDWYWHLLDCGQLEITYDEAAKEKYHLLELAFEDNIWRGNSDHFCGADIYFGDYQLKNNSFEIKQTIKGPYKDYSVLSRYRKL